MSAAKTPKPIAVTSSKGNQEKWCADGRWYKVDLFGYEALAEVFSSHLLSDLPSLTGLPHPMVPYRMERLVLDGRERVGCSSPDFLLPGQMLVTAAQLLKKHIGPDYRVVMAALPSDRQRIFWLADNLAQITGLDDFGQYLTLLFEIDTLLANDDRHLNNIAVLRGADGTYGYCPVFDLGAALLSNTQVCRYDIAPHALLTSLRAAPFAMNHVRMMHTVQAMFGRYLTLSPQRVDDALEHVLPTLAEYYPARDRAEICDRVITVLRARARLFRT